MSAHPRVASVHALDAGVGDGLLADAQVFAELDCRAVSIATAVVGMEPLPPSLVLRQIEAATRTEGIAAARIGYVRGEEQVELLGELIGTAAKEASVVSWSGLDAETREAMLRHVVPRARVVVARASDQTQDGGRDIVDLEELRAAAADLRNRGAKAVVLCGLILRGRVIDLLDDGGSVVVLDTARVQAKRVDGLAGAHAAALAAHLARGLTLAQAAEAAQRYVGFRLRRGR